MGDGLIRVSIDAFEPIEFSNKTNVTINGGPTTEVGFDFIFLVNTEASTGLAAVTVNGGLNAVTDVIIIRSTPPGVTTTVNGGAGGDQIQVQGFDDSLDAIRGPLNLNGEADARHQRRQAHQRHEQRHDPRSPRPGRQYGDVHLRRDQPRRRAAVQRHGRR
jgi:hypothetical protein